MSLQSIVGGMINGTSSVHQLLNDVQLANRFTVTINKSNIFNNARSSTVHVKSINFPNSTSAIKERNVNGIVQKISGLRTIDTINLTMYDAEGGRIRQLFDKWQTEIYDIRTGKAGYYNDYIGSITLNIYGYNFNIARTVLFNEAWPSNVGDISYSRDSSNTLIEFPVSFAFKNYSIN